MVTPGSRNNSTGDLVSNEGNSGMRGIKRGLGRCWEAIAKGKLAEWALIPAGAALFATMVAMAVHVISRKFGHPVPDIIPGTEELMMAVAFLPLAAVALHRQHVYFEILTRKWSPRARAAMDAIAAILGALVFSGITWAGWTAAWTGMLQGEYEMADINFPIWPFRFVLCVGFGIFSFYLLVIAAEEIKKALNRH